MKYYAGIDLHGTNSVVVVLDDDDRVLYQQRLRNELPGVLAAVAPFRETLQGIAVESPYNWYWLVDGLMDAGYVVHLAHVPALPQYAASSTRTIITTPAGWRTSSAWACCRPGTFTPRPTGHCGTYSASAASGCARRPRSS